MVFLLQYKSGVCFGILEYMTFFSQTCKEATSITTRTTNICNVYALILRCFDKLITQLSVELNRLVPKTSVAKHVHACITMTIRRKHHVGYNCIVLFAVLEIKSTAFPLGTDHVHYYVSMGVTAFCLSGTLMF